MAVNVKKFETDIDALLARAGKLDLAMILEATGKEKFRTQVLQAYDDKKAEAILKELPSFKGEYQAWYSECLVLLKQVLPDRLSNFIAHYEAPKGRKDLDAGSYRIQDFLQGITARRYGEVVVDQSAAFPHFAQQWAIIKAAKARFKSSLFELRQLAQADLFDSEIESARHLLKNKFLRAAGAIAGVVLEKHLQQVCDDHHVKVTKKNPTIGDLNELLKAASVIDVPQWRHITLLGDIRNICDHNKQREPSEQQVADLIDGTDKVLKTIA